MASVSVRVNDHIWLYKRWFMHAVCTEIFTKSGQSWRELQLLWDVVDGIWGQFKPRDSTWNPKTVLVMSPLALVNFLDKMNNNSE